MTFKVIINRPENNRCADSFFEVEFIEGIIVPTVFLADVISEFLHDPVLAFGNDVWLACNRCQVHTQLLFCDDLIFREFFQETLQFIATKFHLFLLVFLAGTLVIPACRNRISRRGRKALLRHLFHPDMERVIGKQIRRRDLILAVGIAGNILNHLVIETDAILVFRFPILDHSQLHRNVNSLKPDIGLFQNRIRQCCSRLSAIDDLEIFNLGNQILSIDILNFHALCGCCNSIVIGKELCCIVVYCSFYTVVDALASTGSQKGADISFQYLTSVGNVYLGQKFSRNDCNIGFIPKVLTNVTLYARNTVDSDFRKILLNINDNRLIAVCHFHFIETFRIPQVDFQRFTVKVCFLDLFGCAGFLCGSLFLPDRCFQKIGIQQGCVQFLISKNIELDFQNQLRVVDIAGHPLAEHPCNPEDVIRIIEVVLHPAIADLIQKIIQSPIQFVNPASGEVGGIF